MSDRVRPWMTDTPVSKPGPVRAEQPVLVDFGGVGMSAGGLTSSLTEGEIEDVFFPVYAPQGYRP